MSFSLRGGDLMGKVRTLPAFALAAVLGAALCAGSAFAQDQGAAKDAAPKKMILSGMSAGVLRVPEIAVWSCAGGQMAGCTLVGELKHGTEIMRYEKERARGLDWYRIEGGGLKGWVMYNFVQAPPG
jgi:hypothetical protein